MPWVAAASLLSLVGCAAAQPASVSASSLPAPHLVTASASRSVWIGGGGSAPRAGTAPAAPAVRRHAVWVSTSACAFPLSAADPMSEKVPSFDSRRCVAIVERVLVDGAGDDDRVQKVEELTIEDVAVKLEALLRRDAGGDDGE
ncbi:MAG TPA: hypothetical protein VF997_20205 [Polyangia bacterium]